MESLKKLLDNAVKPAKMYFSLPEAVEMEVIPRARLDSFVSLIA